MKTIKTFAVAVALGLVAASFPTDPAQAIEKIKVSMAARASSYLPYFTAQDKGYFKEEGLVLDILKAGGGTATPALLSGDIQFSTSAASALSGILSSPLTKSSLDEVGMV